MRKQVARYFAVFIMLCVSVGALMYVSRNVQRSEIMLVNLDRQIAKERESIRVLDAEWSYLTRPERIEELAKTYLDMVPPEPDNIVPNIVSRVSDIPRSTLSGLSGGLAEYEGGKYLRKASFANSGNNQGGASGTLRGSSHGSSRSSSYGFSHSGGQVSYNNPRDKSFNNVIDNSLLRIPRKPDFSALPSPAAASSVKKGAR